MLKWKSGPYKHIIRMKNTKLNSAWEEIGTAEVSEDHFTVADLAASCRYSFSVMAVNKLGESEPTIVSFYHRYFFLFVFLLYVVYYVTE